MPRERVRAAARDLVSLLEMAGRPDSDRFAARADRGTDEQRLRSRCREQKREQAEDVPQRHPPSGQLFRRITHARSV